MLLLESRCLEHFRGEVRINLRLIRVVVGEGRVNLRQRQMAKLPQDLLWNQAHVVPLRYAANRDTRAGDAWPSAPDVGMPDLQV